MSSKTIYLIRHGETDYNKKGIVQGSGIDAPLNKQGNIQADSFYQFYKHLPFDKVYTSALIRTHESVKHFINNKLPHQILPELNEISWGIKEGLVPNIGSSQYYNNLTSIWQAGNTNHRVEGGESPEDVAKRQRVAIKHILSQKDEKLVLIAMHGRAMRILLAQITGLPISDMDTFEHRNLCLYILRYNYNFDKFEVIKKNDVAHLSV